MIKESFRRLFIAPAMAGQVQYDAAVRSVADFGSG
jgi:hypothetical protein